MVWVTAKNSFDHNGAKKRGDQFEVSAQQAEQLKRRRLVTLDGDSPKSPGGEQSSALPAAPASAQQMSNASATGAANQAPPLPPIQTPPPLPPALKPPKAPRKPRPKA